MLATIALLHSTTVQHAEFEVHPDDPLHRCVELEVGADGVSMGYAADFDGTLHVWARSEAVDPKLIVESRDHKEPLEDDDSGGGTTPWIAVEVSVGELCLLRVVASAEASGCVDLHLVAASETESTIAAAVAAASELNAIERLQAEGDIDEGRSRVEALVEELRQVEGAGTSQRMSQALWRAGHVAHRLSSPRASLRAWEVAHEHRQRVLPVDHPDLIRAKWNLAVDYSEVGDFASALELKKHVHATRERLLPADHPDLLKAKWSLANTYDDLGDFASALELKEHVHATRERLLPAEHPDLLTSKGGLAVTRAQLGDLAGALELFEHVHAVWERLLPADHPDLLQAKGSLAMTRAELGDLSGALELEEHVHAALERLLAADHPDLLRAKQNLAATRSELGDLSGALELVEHVHAARERLLPADHPDLLVAKMNLAVHRKEALADLVGARELLENVHAAWERTLPADHPDLLTAKQNLAVTRAELGDLGGALELFEHVNAGWEQRLPPDHPAVIRAKANLAVTRYQLGDFAGARELGERVLEASENLPADHPDVLGAKQNLALTRAELGDLAGALELEEHVLAAYARLLPSDHPDLLTAKQNLASTRQQLGDRAGALEATRSLLGSQLARAATLSVESPRIARAAALDEFQRLSSALFLSEATRSEATESLEPELFAVLESLRGVSTSSSEVALAVSSLPELEELRARLATLRGRLNDLGLSPPEEPSVIESWRRSLVELADDRDRLERDLRARLAERGVVTATPTVDAVASGLAEDAALLSFFRYRKHSPRDSQTGRRPPAVDSVLAFVVTPDASVKRVELGLASTIEERLLAWRESLGRPVRGRGVGGLSTAMGNVSREGEKLRRFVLDPILAQLPEVRTLHVVLDDFLHLMPLEALPLDGATVGERFTVRHETTVFRLMRPAAPPTSEPQLVALGGIDYDAEVEVEAALLTTTPPVARRDSSDGTRSGALVEGFAELEGTVEEVESVGALFHDRFDTDPVLLNGEQANKARFRDQAPVARYLHLATHGWFAPEILMSMIDSVEQRNVFFASLTRAEETVRSFAPETLCGLALAGANHGRDELGRVPGILTAEELAGIDLSACELAVLSACETNVGIRRAGQGIQSLQTALHAAGARTAITSLWKVDDFWTRELMTEFYRLIWVEERPKAEALWEAKMQIRERGAGLVDWAGWVLTGDPD